MANTLRQATVNFTSTPGRWHMHGVHAIPPTWTKTLELKEVIAEMADDLATLNEWNFVDDTSTAQVKSYFKRYPGW